MMPILSPYYLNNPENQFFTFVHIPVIVFETPVPVENLALLLHAETSRPSALQHIFQIILTRIFSTRQFLHYLSHIHF